MFSFLIPKTKLQYHTFKELPLEELEIIGISQINPYYRTKYENEKFITVVDILNDSKKYDEKESLVLTNYFVSKRCPKCKKIELIPTKIRINQYREYLRNEEEVAWAREMVALCDEAKAEGKGVALKNGKFVGPPMLKMAQNILDKQRLIESKSCKK